MAMIKFRTFPQEPLDVQAIQSRVNRLFDSVLGSQMSPEGMESVWAPAADMYETKTDLIVSAELPGLNEKDIHLSITGDVLRLQGERQGPSEAQDASHYRSERWFGKFERTFSLPVPVQTEQAKATYRDGVLTVKLPKLEEIKPKEIKIEAA